MATHPDTPVELLRSFNDFEAAQIRCWLEDHGIEARLIQGAKPTAYHAVSTPNAIMVRHADVERARQLVAAHEQDRAVQQHRWANPTPEDLEDLAAQAEAAAPEPPEPVATETDDAAHGKDQPVSTSFILFAAAVAALLLGWQAGWAASVAVAGLTLAFLWWDRWSR